MRNTQPLGLVQAVPGGEAVQGVEVSSEADPLIGRSLGEFRVDGFLAQGGMGRVYTATHRRLPNLRRAVKVLLDTTKEADHAAFLKEAQAASEVKSVNIVALHDFGFLPEGSPYLMMELLEGQTLEQHLRDLVTIPFMQALSLTQQVLAALSAIHGAGLVHRDIKPANLFLVNDASQGVVVKVMDLGLAAARPKSYHETGVGTEKEQNRAGTPVYASPEQFGDLAVGPASDVYSLGVVLYEMICGNVPFPERPGESETALPRRHLKEKPQHPGLHVPDLPEPIASFVLSLLEKEPLKRPTVAAAQNQVKRLRERFNDRLREGPTQIKANPLEPVIRHTDQLPRMSTEEALAGIRRDRRPLAAVIILGGLLLIGLGVLVRMQPDERMKEAVAARAVETPKAPEPAAQAQGQSQSQGMAEGQAQGQAPTQEAAGAPAQEEAASSAAVAAAAGAAAAAAPAAPKPEGDPTSKPSVQPEALAALPTKSSLKPAPPPAPLTVGKAGAVVVSMPPKTKAVVTAPMSCSFDTSLVQYAREERATLRGTSGSSTPTYKLAEQELDTGLVAKDCVRVNAALARLRALAGERTDE